MLFMVIEKFKNGDEIPITDASYIATTDSDGKFSIKVPNGDYVAAADFYRVEHRKFHYHYFWRVPFSATGNEMKIALDTTNMNAKVTIDDAK